MEKVVVGCGIGGGNDGASSGRGGTIQVMMVR